jgi:hypothetical protein
MRIGRRDLGIAVVSLVVSFLLVDLFFGLAILAALVIGGVGLVQIRQRPTVGRTLVDISVGTLLAAVLLVALAILHG